MGIHGGFFGSDLGLVRQREKEGGKRERSESERERREKCSIIYKVFQWV